MFIISEAQIKSLKDRLNIPEERDACIEEVRKMLEIKSGLLWRADVAWCCVGTDMCNYLDAEVRTLEDILIALEKGNIVGGLLMLDAYESMFCKYSRPDLF